VCREKAVSPKKEGCFFLVWSLGWLAFAVLVCVSFPSLLQARESSTWPATDGTITRSKIASGDESDYFDVNYSYDVDGKRYRGDKLSLDGFTPNTLQDLCARYPVGKTVLVYYRPQDPTKSCLIPGHRHWLNEFLWRCLSQVLCVVIGIVGLRQSFIAFRRSD
jgi:hypothetical protein